MLFSRSGSTLKGALTSAIDQKVIAQMVEGLSEKNCSIKLSAIDSRRKHGVLWWDLAVGQTNIWQKLDFGNSNQNRSNSETSDWARNGRFEYRKANLRLFSRAILPIYCWPKLVSLFDLKQISKWDDQGSGWVLPQGRKRPGLKWFH